MVIGLLRDFISLIHSCRLCIASSAPCPSTSTSWPCFVWSLSTGALPGGRTRWIDPKRHHSADAGNREQPRPPTAGAHTRSVRVTPAGEFLYRESARLLGNVEQSLNHLSQEFGGARKEVRGRIPDIGLAYLPGSFMRTCGTSHIWATGSPASSAVRS